MSTFRSMELLMFWQFSFSAPCTCSILHQKSNTVFSTSLRLIKSNTVFSTSLSLIKVVKLPCSESMSCESPCFHGKYILTYSEALTKLLSASFLDKFILSIIACPHLSRQKQTDKNTSKINKGESCHSIALRLPINFGNNTLIKSDQSNQYPSPKLAHMYLLYRRFGILISTSVN